MVAVVHGMLAHHPETYKGEGHATVVRLLGREVCSGLLAEGRVKGVPAGARYADRPRTPTQV